MMKIISSPLLKQYAVIITVNLMNLCVGLDLGWSSPVLVKLRDPKQSPLSHPITDDESGWIVSIGYIVSIFMLPFIGILLDYIGRRYSILLICLPKIAANVMIIFANEIWILLVARAINGVITFAAYISITVYTTEIASKEIRGSLGSFIAIFSNLGVFVMLSIGPYISYLSLCIMVTAISICASIPQIFIPDSPYSLYKKGKIEEAKKVLILFRGSQSLAEEELKEYSEAKPTKRLEISDVLKNKTYLKSFAIIIVLAIGTQLIGFNFISFYLQSILEMSNTSVSSAMGSVVIGFIQIISSVFAGIFMDRFGRRPILLTTYLTLALGMIGLGIFFMVKKHAEITGLLNYLPLICIAIITCSFSGGIGCLYFVLVSELLDGPIRAIASSVGSIAATITVFLLTRYAMDILSVFGSDYTFIMFGVINILMWVFIYFIVPETKQKTIAEIQKALGQKADGGIDNYVTKF